MRNNKNIRSGIEVDQYGAPVAYWILKTHPENSSIYSSESKEDFVRIPAFTEFGRRRVIHLYDKERAAQSRGRPMFSAVMKDFRSSGKYLSAEVDAAVANALVAAYIESNLGPTEVYDLFGNDEDGDYWSAIADKYHKAPLEGGTTMVLPVGTKLSSHDTTRPNKDFGPFMEEIDRRTGVGIDMPYELFMKDFSKTNYSSLQASLAEARRYFNGQRATVVQMVLGPIDELWMEEAINSGRIEAPDYYANKYAYLKSRWIFAGRGYVDQVKEANAATMRMDNGTSTLEDECADQGKDWEEVLEQRAIEIKTRRALEIPDPIDAMIQPDEIYDDNANQPSDGQTDD